LCTEDLFVAGAGVLRLSLWLLVLAVSLFLTTACFFSSSSYVRFDIIRRIMARFFGIEVIMVMGITDIDDKIIKRANEVGVCCGL